MSYLGTWPIDALLTFVCNTQVFSTGVATDADSVPTYRVYEDETGTPILTGSMALLDSANTAGFYSEQITLSAANGFETGKAYSIYIAATVSSVAGATHRTFQVQPVPLAPVTPGRLLDVTAANKVNGVVLVDTVTTYTGNTPQTGDNFARIGAAGAGLTALGDARIVNLDATVSSRLATAGYTAPDSAATIAAAVWATVIDGTNSAIKLMRGLAAAMLGKASGLETTNAKYRNIADSKNVIDATVDADGNRTAVTLDLT